MKGPSVTRDLPKTLPPAVLAAAERAIAKTDDIILKRRRAHEIYHGDAFRRHANEARAHVMFDDLLAKAQALVEWGVMVRESLPLRGWLVNRFRTPGGGCKSLPAIRHEMAFAESEGFPGGRLTTELELELDEEEGLFRHYARFDGFPMTGGGVLNTANGLHLTIHPEALSQIHRLVADGQNWRHIELGFDRLVDAYKDR